MERESKERTARGKAGHSWNVNSIWWGNQCYEPINHKSLIYFMSAWRCWENSYLTEPFPEFWNHAVENYNLMNNFSHGLIPQNTFLFLFVAGARSNCYTFITLITGSSRSTIVQVSHQMKQTGGDREPPVHGMKRYWKESGKCRDTETPSSKISPRKLSHATTYDLTWISTNQRYAYFILRLQEWLDYEQIFSTFCFYYVLC